MKAQKNRLYKDVEVLAGIKPFRNYQNMASLRFVANYIRKEFEACGLACEEQRWIADGREYKNIICSYNAEKTKRLIIGAHYDAAGDQPGADDNASGVAGLLETAKIRNPNYHEPSDTIDTLNFDRMSEAINSTYIAAVKLEIE
jgi:hypothetical protein